MDGFSPINFPKSTKTQRNKDRMRQRTVVVVLFLRTFSCPLGCITCKCVWTHAAFNLKRVPGELYTVCLIKLNRALSRI